MTYTIAQHHRMLADQKRMDAYAAALRKTVRADSVVVDIGTGLGVFALLSLQNGARRVYAIETSDVIELAREIATANHCDHAIEFIHDLSANVVLPERADVIVSDLHGALPYYSQHIPTIMDARRRFLRPGGALVPQRDALFGAVAEAPELWLAPGACGFNMEPALRYLTNSWRKARVQREQLLVEPSQVCLINYHQVESPNLAAEVAWTVERSGTAHGIVVWFDSTLAEDVHLSNAPGATELVYANAFFPFSQPIAMMAGVRVEVTLDARLFGDDYIWCWSTRVCDRSRVLAATKQSTFSGFPLSPDRLHKQTDRHVPMLNKDGEIDNFILGEMKGERSVAEIAQTASAALADRFSSEGEALTRVRELSVKYSR